MSASPSAGPLSAPAPTGDPDRRGSSTLVTAFLVALSLHGSALIALTLFQPEPKAPPGENIVTIDLAPQMTEADTQAPAEQAASVAAPPEAKPVETPETVQQEKPLETTEVTPPEATAPPPPDTAMVAPEATTVAEPPDAPPVPPVAEATEPPPEDQVITSTGEDAPALAPPPAVVAQELPKPVEKPKPDEAKILEARREAKRKAEREARLKAEREEERREAREEAREEARKEAKAKAAREAARRAAAAASEGRARQNSASASRQSSTGAAAGGNNANALRAWQGALSAAIRGRMNANAAAGTSGGVAVVRFTVSRSGQVLSSGLSSSSGIGAIDSAALATVRGSLPAAPAGVTISSLAVTVPLRFSPGR